MGYSLFFDIWIAILHYMYKSENLQGGFRWKNNSGHPLHIDDSRHIECGKVAWEDSRKSEGKRGHGIILNKAHIKELGGGWLDCQGAESKTAVRDVGVKPERVCHNRLEKTEGIKKYSPLSKVAKRERSVDK